MDFTMDFTNELNDRQRKAWTTITKWTEKGYSVAEAARKTKTKTSDYYNAKNRLKKIEKGFQSTQETIQNWRNKISENKESTVITPKTDTSTKTESLNFDLKYFFETNPTVAVTLASGEAVLDSEGDILKMTQNEFFNLVKFYNLLGRN